MRSAFVLPSERLAASTCRGSCSDFRGRTPLRGSGDKYLAIITPNSRDDIRPTFALIPFDSRVGSEALLRLVVCCAEVRSLEVQYILGFWHLIRKNAPPIANYRAVHAELMPTLLVERENRV